MIFYFYFGAEKLDFSNTKQPPALENTVENHTEDLAEAMGRVTLDPDPAPTPRGGGQYPRDFQLSISHAAR